MAMCPKCGNKDLEELGRTDEGEGYGCPKCRISWWMQSYEPDEGIGCHECQFDGRVDCASYAKCSQEAKCRECGWEGKLRECGFGHNEHYCPGCGKETLNVAEFQQEPITQEDDTREGKNTLAGWSDIISRSGREEVKNGK